MAASIAEVTSLEPMNRFITQSEIFQAFFF